MFDNQEMQGYLSVTSNLAWIAGAHRIDFWDANKSVVMACFSRATVAGQEVIYYPPLVRLIEKQLKLLKQKKSRAGPDALASESCLSLSFDFDSKNLTTSSTCAPAPARKKPCSVHPGLGVTDWGECVGCYGRKYQSGCEPA